MELRRGHRCVLPSPLRLVCAHFLEKSHGAYSDSNTNVKIMKWNAGTPTTLFTGTQFSAGDVLRLEIQGTTLTLKKNGSVVTTTTDSTFSSGSPGIVGFGNLTTTRADDFNAGSVSQGGGGGGPTP